MANGRESQALSTPGLYLFRMVVFLVLAGVLAFVLQKRILDAFWFNPLLNGIIGLVLLLGVVFAFAQCGRTHSAGAHGGASG
jgi:uncharacterized protein YqhQ